MAKKEKQNSGNPKGNPNPNIAEAGANTQFGAPGGPDPVEAVKKSNEAQAARNSFRGELSYVLAHDFGECHTEADLNAELKKLKKRADGSMTGARMLAVRTLERGLKKAEPAIVFGIAENVEGKLSQEIVLPAATRAPTTAKTLEEAEALYKQHMPR